MKRETLPAGTGGCARRRARLERRAERSASPSPGPVRPRCGHAPVAAAPTTAATLAAILTR